VEDLTQVKAREVVAADVSPLKFFKE